MRHLVREPGNTHHVKDPAALQVDVQLGFCSDLQTLLLYKNSNKHVVIVCPLQTDVSALFIFSHLQSVFELLQLAPHFLHKEKQRIGT